MIVSHFTFSFKVRSAMRSDITCIPSVKQGHAKNGGNLHTLVKQPIGLVEKGLLKDFQRLFNNTLHLLHHNCNESFVWMNFRYFSQLCCWSEIFYMI